jgi:CRISPR-associated protein (TIGR03986 family)
MSNIKTPYNFVPISEHVVKPYWADHISHDIPFEDHQSGELEVTMEAASPIFVKNGIGKEEEKFYKNDKGEQFKAYEFNQFQDKYFISGSSIKGMVRSVLEIMSFGRMENKVNDVRYSVRDFNNNNIYPVSEISKTVLCGWLKKINGEYCLQDCDTPIRISYDKIDEFCGSDLTAFFKEKSNNTTKTKSAKFKYNKFTEIKQRSSFLTYDTKYGIRGMYDPDEGLSGTLVMTGQPGVRQKRNDKWSGKFHDFIFFDSDKDFQGVEDDVISNFFFAYYDHDVNNQKDDWKWRKPQLDNGDAIPVFFRKEDGKIKDMGLSMLYKITYDYSVKESIKKHQKNTNYDLSEAIFGFVEDKKALKGRVHFGHAFAGNAETMGDQKEVLAGPKASYYPTYIRQNIKNGRVRDYNTFMDESAVIAGWKRYPVTNAIKHNPPPIIKGRTNDKIATKFIPLKEGARFKFKIRYHNLKKIELGALLSALTFHQTEGTFHSLGMAKPLGYGKIKLNIGGVSESDMEECLCAFESYMNVALKNDLPEWRVSEQITELITMVSEQEDNKPGKPYMELTEFPVAKKANQALDLYSNLVNKRGELKTFCSQDDIKTMKLTMNKEKEEFLNLRSVDEIIDDNIKNQKQIIAELFEEKKRQLLKDLANKHEEIKELERQRAAEKEAKERKERKAEIQKTIHASGIDLEGINVNDKQAFDLLRKEIESFARKYHNMADKQLSIAFPDGLLPENSYDTVGNKIQEIFSHLNKKNKKKWLKANSSQFKKFVDWLGKGKAEDLFKKLLE